MKMSGHKQHEAAMQEEEMVIDQIIGRRVVGGKVEYLLKWKGLSSFNNSWEPKENLNAYSDLIQAFEKARNNQDSTTTSATTKTSTFKKPEVPPPAGTSSGAKKGFDRGLEPEKILGATIHTGQLILLIKWKNAPDADFVPAKEAKAKCPQLVIDFYQDRLIFIEEPKAVADDSEPTMDENRNGGGFDRGLQPKEILGATNRKGQLMFLMKWKNATRAHLVAAEQANLKCPQVVLDFYEQRMVW